MKCEQRSAVLLNVRVAVRVSRCGGGGKRKGPLRGLRQKEGPSRGLWSCATCSAAYFGTREQSVELMLVLQPEMAEVSGTKEAPRLMTLLRTVTPTKVPA